MSGSQTVFDMFAVEQSIREALPEIVFAPPRMVRRIIRGVICALQKSPDLPANRAA